MPEKQDKKSKKNKQIEKKPPIGGFSIAQDQYELFTNYDIWIPLNLIVVCLNSVYRTIMICHPRNVVELCVGRIQTFQRDCGFSRSDPGLICLAQAERTSLFSMKNLLNSCSSCLFGHHSSSSFPLSERSKLMAVYCDRRDLRLYLSP